VSRAQRAVGKIIAPAQNITHGERIVLCYVIANACDHLRRRLGKSVMKKFLFGSVAVAALITANAASAADMGLPVKGRALEPAWNWSGFYAGLNAGYARGTTVWNDLDGTINGVGGVLVHESTSGFIGGGQVGYNWQSRYAVFGLEADFDYLSLKQTTRLLDLTDPSATHWQIKGAVPWLGTVRGRAGLALDNVLIYLTAGLAYGRTEHTIIGSFVPNPHDLSTTKIGAVAGFGMEYGLDPRWSVKAEALYVDLGKNSGLCCGDANSGGFTGRFDVNDTMWIVHAGVNYKFGG
jgi:outer membrane immunogenic protein